MAPPRQTEHGNRTMYRRGCRCDLCREAETIAARIRRGPGRTDLAPIHCGKCGDEIEGCDGLDSDWMHTLTRREHGHDGHLAAPETADQRGYRLARGRGMP